MLFPVLRLHLHRLTFACTTGLIHAKIENGRESAFSPPLKILNLFNKVINKRPTTPLPLAENYLSNTHPRWEKNLDPRVVDLELFSAWKLQKVFTCCHRFVGKLWDSSS